MRNIYSVWAPRPGPKAEWGGSEREIEESRTSLLALSLESRLINCNRSYLVVTTLHVLQGKTLSFCMEELQQGLKHSSKKKKNCKLGIITFILLILIEGTLGIVDVLFTQTKWNLYRQTQYLSAKFQTQPTHVACHDFPGKSVTSPASWLNWHWNIQQLPHCHSWGTHFGIMTS